MPLRIQGLGQGRPEHSVGPVLIALPALILHNIALDVQLVLAHIGQQAPHPISLQPQGQLERVRRHDLEVVRSIRVRTAVVHAPGGFEKVIEIALGYVAAPFEHEVLKQVGETAPALLFVTGPDMVPYVHGDDRDRPILVDEKRETVIERKALVWNRDLSFCSLGGRAGREDEQE